MRVNVAMLPGQAGPVDISVGSTVADLLQTVGITNPDGWSASVGGSTILYGALATTPLSEGAQIQIWKGNESGAC